MGDRGIQSSCHFRETVISLGAWEFGRQGRRPGSQRTSTPHFEVQWRFYGEYIAIFLGFQSLVVSNINNADRTFCDLAGSSMMRKRDGSILYFTSHFGWYFRDLLEFKTRPPSATDRPKDMVVQSGVLIPWDPTMKLTTIWYVACSTIVLHFLSGLLVTSCAIWRSIFTYLRSPD